MIWNAGASGTEGFSLSGGGSMSEKSARPRLYIGPIQMNTVSKLIKTLSNAINGCAAAHFFPPD